ncbi:MAG: nuclear transport factor 2 family protein [Pseudomonadota bacterium]
MSHFETAQAFFDACETGKGAEVCAQWCTSDASFACQADALADVTTLAAYCDWMQGLLTPVPDGRYVLTAFAFDEARATAVAAAEFHGAQTGEGGPVPPTGKAVVSDYAYVMVFDGDKISHMTKIWNDAVALRGLGWA